MIAFGSGTSDVSQSDSAALVVHIPFCNDIIDYCNISSDGEILADTTEITLFLIRFFRPGIVYQGFATFFARELFQKKIWFEGPFSKKRLFFEEHKLKKLYF